MPMESKLSRLIALAEIITDINEQTEDTPIVLRHTDENTGQTIAIVCSRVEPTNMVLPLNVIWFVYDSTSTFYRRALKRVSKTAGEENTFNGFQQSWAGVYFYEDIFEHQYFDTEDMAQFSIPDVPLATVEQLGKTRLRTDPLDAQNPVAISTTDPRMIDNRDPLDHSHPEVPATKIFSGTNVLDIVDQSTPFRGYTLHFDSSGTVVWDQIKETDIEAGDYRG